MSYKKLNTLVEFYELYPMIIKKDRNHSSELYSVLSSTKSNTHNAAATSIKQKTTKDRDARELAGLIWDRVQEKYKKIASAFRFFDLNSNGSISLNEFTVGVEGLAIKLTTEETEKVFQYLDKDHDGNIGYMEFCELCEERRRDIDPYTREVVFSKVNSDAFANAGVDDELTLLEAKRKKQKMNGLPSRHNPSHTYGQKSLRSEAMDDVIAFKWKG